MNGKKDKTATDHGPNQNRNANATNAAGSLENDAGATNRSGRVQFDARGNPIWEWQIETGVYGRDISTQRLQRLTPKELSLLETGAHEALDSGKRDIGSGFNPYESSAPAKPNPFGRARVAPDPGPDVQPRKRTLDDMRKLSEAIKQKKKLERNR